MAKYKPDLISPAECARRKKVSSAAVTGWMKTKKIKAYRSGNGDVKVDWNEAKRYEPKRPLSQRPVYVPEPDEDPEGNGVYDLAKAKLKRETFLAHTAELEFKKASGELVSAADVAKQWEGIAANVRRRILVLADRLAPLVAAEMDPRKVHAMITKELHECLTTLNQSPDDEMEIDHGGDESFEP